MNAKISKSKIAFMLGALVALPGLYVICFHFGWGNRFQSPQIIAECLIAGYVFAICQAAALIFLPTKNRYVIAALTLVYYAAIFALSSFAIIYGWGMVPKSWIVIVFCYACAACLPPFSEISQQLMFWKERSEPGTEEFLGMQVENAVLAGDRAALANAIADALTILRVPTMRSHEDASKTLSNVLDFVNSRHGEKG